MMIVLKDKHDVDMALCAIKTFLLKKTDVIKIRKSIKSNLMNIAKISDALED